MIQIFTRRGSVAPHGPDEHDQAGEVSRPAGRLGWGDEPRGQSRDAMWTGCVLPIGAASPKPEVLNVFDEAVVYQGRLNDGPEFLQRLLTCHTLSRRVREVLDRPPHVLAETGCSAVART